MRDGMDMITFAIGDSQFGIDLSVVEEVSADTELELAGPDDGPVTGFAHHHDRRVPVYNLRELLGLDAEDDEAAGGGRVIVVRLAGGVRVGLRVDGAADIRKGVPAPAAAPILYGGRPRAALVQGLVEADGRIVPLLDPGRLLTDDELRRSRNPGSPS